MYGKVKPAHNAKYNNPDFIGEKFGRLTVFGIEHVIQGKHPRWMWRCHCECGNEAVLRAEYVYRGHTSSCGCVARENKPNWRHGENNSRLHAIWCGMRDRCRPGHSIARWHGDRGIMVCDEWQDYVTFAKWARDNGYNDNLSIERIDNDGNYCPENCKWIERGKQARNRRTTFYVEYLGKRMPLVEACELAKMPYKQVHARIHSMGWPVEDALSIPINTTRKWKRSDRFCKRDFNCP